MTPCKYCGYNSPILAESVPQYEGDEFIGVNVIVECICGAKTETFIDEESMQQDKVEKTSG